MSTPSASEGPIRMPSVSRPTRRPSQSTPSGASVVRRPSRAGHQLPVPHKPLSHQEALEALRSFLKERSSYDVFPVSFRLIVLDSQLKVKKALDVMLLYGMWDLTMAADMDRSRFCAALEHGNSIFRGDVYCAGCHPSHPVLLPHLQLGGRCRRRRAVPSRQPSRFVARDVINAYHQTSRGSCRSLRLRWFRFTLCGRCSTRASV